MTRIASSPAFVSQQAFARALLDPAHDLPTGLRVAPGVDPRRRFAVHRNNVVVALVDALASAFPVTQALVGEAFFRAMARERVVVDPPRSPVLAEYGDGFADFIAGFAPAAGVPYLTDMARLEQLRVQAYHAADAQPVAVAAYQALVAAPARLAATRLTLHPACRWLHSDHAVHAIWQAHQQQADVRDADLDAIAIDTPEDVLVVRPRLEVGSQALAGVGLAWIEALRVGKPLGEAVAQPCAGNQATTIAARLQAIFTLIVQHGLAVALHSPTEP